MVPYLRREREETGNICFVQKGKRCQADLLGKFIEDKANTLTLPTARILDLVNDFRAAVERFNNAIPPPGPNADKYPRYGDRDQLYDYEDELKSYKRQVRSWEDYFEDGREMQGKQSEDWSCVTGTCSGQVCGDGVNRLLKRLPSDLHRSPSDTDTDASPNSSSTSSERVKAMRLTCYLLIMFSGVGSSYFSLYGLESIV